MAGSVQFAPVENCAPNSLARKVRVNKERADLRGFKTRIEQARVAFGKLVAAEKCLAFTPAAAANDYVVRFRNKISSIFNQHAIHPVNGLHRGTDLFLAVISATQFARRDCD